MNMGPMFVVFSLLGAHEHMPVMATPSLADPVTTYVVARLWSGRGFEGEFVLVNVIPRV